MVFYGVNRLLAQWTNDATTWVSFDIHSITPVSVHVDVGVTWTGNSDLIFNLVFSVTTLQTYYCPASSPNKYYQLSDYRCADNCNAGIQQYANASRYCRPCADKCYKCVTTSTTCTACYNTQNRILASSDCICDVAGGFYEDGSSLICPSCNYTCKTCSGGGGGSCLSCESTAHRELSGTSCPCTTGHFDNGTAICQDCHYTCFTGTCTLNTAVRCTSCNASRHRQFLGNSTCGCVTGFYDNGTNS